MDETTSDRRGLFRYAFGRAVQTPVGESPETPTRGRLGSSTASTDDLLDAARELGLESRIGALRGLARRSIRLGPAQGRGSEAVVFGGPVLLTSGVEWPHWQGRPLTFLARVERRQFFFDTSSLPSGLQAGHRGAGRVLAVPEDDPVAVDGPAWPPVRRGGDFAAELVMPRVWSAVVEELGLTEDERAAWETLRARLASDQGTELTDQVPIEILHRIFGYPDHTGGDMPRICERCAGGEDFVSGHHELEQAAARWQLLAQFSADPELGWTWPGRVYFWTDREGEVWTIRR
jgi:Domain of unknown function (DUF1963)